MYIHAYVHVLHLHVQGDRVMSMYMYMSTYMYMYIIMYMHILYMRTYKHKNAQNTCAHACIYMYIVHVPTYMYMILCIKQVVFESEHTGTCCQDKNMHTC